MKYKVIVYLLPIIWVKFIVLVSANDKDSWLDPDAWARDHYSLNSLKSSGEKCCKCLEDKIENKNAVKSQPELPNNLEDVASIIFLKKFITMLFNREHLKFESTSQIYERSVIFTLQPSQLDKLEQLQDPRDLDNILTEIFKNVRIPNMYSDGQRHHTPDVSSNFMSSVYDMFYNMLKLTKMSEVRFLLVVIIVVLFATVIKNRFNISLFALIFGGMFIYGYLHTYLECNREIEVNRLLEILKRSDEENAIATESRIVTFLKSIFSSENPEHEALKKSAKFSPDFCRPDHVLIIYFNDIFIRNVQALLEQCTLTIKSFNSNFSFPLNLIAPAFLLAAICYILKLTFQYILSPSAWVQFAQSKQWEPIIPTLTNTQSKQNEDRISGENLKLLLNAINGASYQNTVSPLTASGVQDVKETIESSPKDVNENTGTHIMEQPENNNSTTKLLDCVSDATLEDLDKNS